MEWKWKLSGRGISTGNSPSEVHSVRFSRMMEDILRRTGKAMVPAVTAIWRGESGLNPRREQNCSRKLSSTWVQRGESEEKASWYGEEEVLLTQHSAFIKRAISGISLMSNEKGESDLQDGVVGRRGSLLGRRPEPEVLDLLCPS